MTHRSPLLTLAAVAIFFAALLAADFVVHPSAESATAPAAPDSRSAQASAAAPSSSTGYPTAAAPSSVAPPSAAPSSAPSASAEADDRFPQKAVYVGRTGDPSVAVAIAVLRDRTVAYVCDGRNREAWLRGTVAGDTVRLSSEAGYRITAELNGDGRLEGEVRGDGRRWNFEIRRADPPAGLYRAKGSRSTIGWIRLPDGSLVGVVTADDKTSGPAPALGSDQKAAVDGETVQATPVDGDTEI